jgi:hypothetical protein
MDRTERVRSRRAVHAHARRTGWGGAGEGWTRVADGVWEARRGKVGAYLGDTRHGQAHGHRRDDRCAPSPAPGLPPRLDAIPQMEIPLHRNKGEIQ